MFFIEGAGVGFEVAEAKGLPRGEFSVSGAHCCVSLGWPGPGQGTFLVSSRAWGGEAGGGGNEGTGFPGEGKPSCLRKTSALRFWRTLVPSPLSMPPHVLRSLVLSPHSPRGHSNRDHIS